MIKGICDERINVCAYNKVTLVRVGGVLDLVTVVIIRVECKAGSAEISASFSYTKFSEGSAN